MSQGPLSLQMLVLVVVLFIIAVVVHSCACGLIVKKIIGGRKKKNLAESRDADTSRAPLFVQVFGHSLIV